MEEKLLKNNIKEKRLLTPKYDVIFQALFGVKGSEEILGELLLLVKNIEMHILYGI